MPSTAIRNLFYVPAKRELWITFVSGRRYVYTDVPPDVFDAFKVASSRGTFFNQEIATDIGFARSDAERQRGSGERHRLELLLKHLCQRTIG